MLLAIVLGLSAGLGLVLFLRSLKPAPLDVAEYLSIMETPEAPPPPPETERKRMEILRSLDRRIGNQLAASIPTPRKDVEQLAKDLRVAGWNRAELAVDMFVLPIVVVIFAGLITLVYLAFEVTPPVSAMALLVPLGFSIAPFVPLLLLKSAAEERRQEFRLGLSAFLDLVAISLAGGAPYQQAMQDAASAGNGWVFTELQRPLVAARDRGLPPWDGIRDLGRSLGVPELEELTSSISLAGVEGAHVGESLTSKADSLRARRISEAEAEAERVSERMSLPVAILALAFVALIGYPALASALTGFGE